MNRYHLPIICLIAMSVVITGNSQVSTNDWHPNTRLLDLAAKKHHVLVPEDSTNAQEHESEWDAASTLARDVKRFYQLLRDKQWQETYELRAKAYREDTPESVYISGAEGYEKIWGLVNYDVLSVEFDKSYASTNYDQATLICKFTELPGNEVSYSTVFWHKEDGVWKCLSAGPSNFPIFSGTRPPIIDWR